jgi:hypothetical protein
MSNHRVARPTRTAVRRLCAVLLAVTLGVTVGPGVAPASADTTTTITFDDLADGTLVGTQYSGQGVTFVETAGSLGSTGVPRVLANAALAHTDPNVIESRCFGCEFVAHGIRANLSTTAKVVSARVSSGCEPPNTATVTMRGYDTSNGVVATTSGVLGNTMLPFTISDPSGSDIAFVRFFDDTQGCSIRVDSFSVTLPDGGPPADLGLTTSASIVTVAAGAPQTVPISVNRVNGSNGDLTLGMSGQGAGVTAAFTPNPVGGTGTSSSLVVSASEGAPYDEGFSTQATVTGTPASAAVAPGPRSTGFLLRVVPTLTTTAPASITAPVCGTTSGTVYQGRVAPYAGTVTLGATGLPAGVGVTFTPPTSGGPTNPSVHQMQVTPQATASQITTNIQVRGTGPGATTRGDTVALAVTAMGFVDVPASVEPGQSISLRSTGFCPGSQFRFGNDKATITPGAGAYSDGGTRVQLTVPRLATTGTIRVIASGIQVGQTGQVKVREFRRTTGMSFVNNYGNHPMNHAILEKTYGRSETNLSIDVCWPFGCQIVSDWIDPFAWFFMKIANEVLTSGSCFGIATTGQRIAKGRVPLSAYPPAGATTPWELTGPTGPADAIRNTISGWHSVQLSTQFIQDWGTEFVNNAIQPAEILRSRFAAASPSNPLLLSFKSGTSGHAVIAYGWRGLPNGAWEVDISDPNIPYTTAEETDLTGAAHEGALNRSTMTFDGAGNWSYPGTGWSGGKHAIAIVPYRDWPTDPDMPTGIRDILSLIVPFGDAPAGTVTDASGRTLAADGSGNLPGQAIPMFSGVGDQQVAFAIPDTGPLTYSVANAADRTYGQGITGPGMAAMVNGIEGPAGGTDLIGSDPDQGTVWLDPAAKAGGLVVEVARQEKGKNGARRVVDLDLGGVDDGRTTVTLPKGNGPLTVANAGGTMTVKGTVGRVGGKGVAGIVRLPRTKLGPGQRLLVKPSWTKLASKATLVEVRDAKGKLVSSTRITPPAPTYLRSASASLSTVKDNKRKLVVTATGAKLPAGSHLVYKVKVFKGSKLVKTVLRDRAWRGGTKSWSTRLKLKDGGYRVQLVAAAVVLRDRVPVSDFLRKTASFRLR